MTRRNLAKVAGWTLALAALGATACGTMDETPKRVIWISIDSLSAQRLGFMGYSSPTSPRLDALAAESVVFENAYAPSNVTPRSVAASMTGRHYSQIQRDLYEQRLPPDFTTLAEWFQERGFRTTGFNTNPLLRAGTGFEQGFDAYHDLLPEERTKATLEELIAAVRESYRPTGGREFLYLHTMDVHHPYLPPDAHRQLFERAGYAGTAVKDGNLLRPNGSLVFGNLPYFRETQRVTTADIDHLLSLYEGAIHYTDRFLPDLLDALRYDSASDLLLLSADHGEQFFEHGYWLHGRTLMPEEIHVPLLVRWDGFPRHAISTPVSLVDWFPTFAELFGAAAPEGLAGRSLLPGLAGDRLASEPVYSEGHIYDANGAAVVADGHLYWLCTDNTKLTPWLEWPYSEALCDLESDPPCQNDLLADSSDNADAAEHARLGDRLNTVLREINPVWRNFSRQAVRPPDAGVPHGPQLLEHAPPSVSLAAAAPDLVLRASLDEPNDFHLLTLEYRLSSGEMHVALEDAAAGGVLYRHRVLYPSRQWRTLRARLRPGAPELTLRVGAEAGGEVELRSAELHHLIIPEIPIYVWPDAARLRETKAPLSPDEVERLRALGYLE